EGKLETDGKSITGTLSQGTNPMPLPLKRATAQTAWELPPPPAAPKGLPEGAKLEFEVASIKPSPAGQPGNAGFNVTATEMRTRKSAFSRRNDGQRCEPTAASRARPPRHRPIRTHGSLRLHARLEAGRVPVSKCARAAACCCRSGCRRATGSVYRFPGATRHE